MIESRIGHNSPPPDNTDPVASGRKTAREALNWVLVPVSAGAIANTAVTGLTTLIGASLGATLGSSVVVAVVFGTALAKYMTEKKSAEQDKGSSQ